MAALFRLLTLVPLLFNGLLDGISLIEQAESKLNNTPALTIFYPTTKAFHDLNSSPRFKNLNSKQKFLLFLYHFVPQFFDLSQLLTLTSPVKTEASNSSSGGGDWELNFNSHGAEVNVSTGIVTVTIRLKVDFPALVIYLVDQVLLPPELFGEKVAVLKNASAPVPAPAPAPAPDPVKYTSVSPAPSELITPGGGVRNLGGLGLAFALGLISNVLLLFI